MAFLRRLYRIAAIIIWAIIITILSIPSQLQKTWKSTKTLTYLGHLWLKGIAAIVGLRITVRGELPAVPGGLVVSNHLSYVDILAYGSTLPLRYTPKSDIAAWPVLGWYIGLSRPIWINRTSKQASQKALRAFAKTMKQGMYLIVFPEGTSTDGKHGILPFKSTPFEAAVTKDAPIIPVLIKYKEVRGRPTVAWYGDMTLMPHIWQVLAFPAIDAEIRFLDPIYPEGRSRKALAEYVHSVMSKEFQ